MVHYNYKKQNLNTMQSKIIETIINSPIMFAGRNYVLLAFSDCGNDPQLYTQLNLMEKMLEKHFNIISRKAYLGQRDIVLSQDIA